MKRWNWPLWTGLLLCIAAFGSYFAVFARWPLTRDVPWVNILLFLLASALLVAGVRRAFVPPASTARKIASIAVTAIGLAIFVMFGLTVFTATKVPASPRAPAVGEKAPEFTLLDSNNKPVSLTHLLAGAPRGVILIFYRGYW